MLKLASSIRLVAFRTTLPGAFRSFTSAPNTTMDQSEIDRFSSLSNEWWDENGPLKPLLSMNRLRVPWIRDLLLTNSSSKPKSMSQPLVGFRLLDVGCGAGILSEPLARLGASVLGVDASVENINMAKAHAAQYQLDTNYKLNYDSCLIEDLRLNPKIEPFDAVIASEVVEHVANVGHFVECCVSLTRPGGKLFMTTMNRTWLSRLLGIFLAEDVLRIVPKGVHDWEKFVSPEDLQFLLEKNNDCAVTSLHGMTYNPLTNRWRWIRDTSVNYAMCASKI